MEDDTRALVLIVTANLKDFPPEALDPHQIEGISPDRFLRLLYRHAPGAMVDIVVRQAAELRNPPLSVERLLVGIARDAPTIADAIRVRMAAGY